MDIDLVCGGRDVEGTGDGNFGQHCFEIEMELELELELELEMEMECGRRIGVLIALKLVLALIMPRHSYLTFEQT
jgi:hypothetical protein